MRNVGMQSKKVRSENKEGIKIEKRTGEKQKNFESKLLRKISLI